MIGTVAILLVLLVQLLIARHDDRALVRELVSAPELAALGSDSLPTIAVFFRLDDCTSSIDALRHLNAAMDGGRVKVHALVLGADEDSASLQTILGGSGIRYSIRGNADPHIRRVFSSLGHSATPVAVVLDRHRQVRLIVPALELGSRAKSHQLAEYAATLIEPVEQPKLALALPGS